MPPANIYLIGNAVVVVDIFYVWEFKKRVQRDNYGKK
jgi:hypothetical protein